MRIKSNIKFISLFPIILLMMVSSYIIFNEYNIFKNLQKSSKNIKKIEILDTLLTNLSYERELAIKNILSNSNEAEFELNKDIKNTNNSVKDIVKLYNQNKNDKLTYKIIEDIKHIVNIRKDIKNKTISYEKLFAIYDNTNSDILLKISSLQVISKPKVVKYTDSYIKSIKLKKALSDERDFIAKIFSKNDDINNLYMAKILKTSNIYQTFSLLDKDIKSIVTKYLDNSNFLDLLKKTNKIKKDILQKGFTEDHSLDEWYKLEDEKIKILSNTTAIIKDKTIKTISLNSEITLAKIILASIIIMLAFIMLFKYFKIKNFLYDTHYIKQLLQKAVNSNKIDKNIDFDTTSGIQEAYKMIDISLDKIELERQKANNENASKSIFLANMSHEIRTPINGIVGFTDLLKKSNLNPEQQEYIEIISKSTDNLLDIINNILDLSKIESKKVEIDSITFSPIEEFENTVELFIAKAAKKDINLSLFLDTHFQNYLIGDILKVKEVLLNLISNAIKFTPNNGEINVRIKQIPTNDTMKEKIYFEVTDNGIGMSQDELGEVFEAFTQADSTITRKYGGTGLGLTISSNYVSLLGGKLEVYSKKDNGTTFYFTLEFKKSQSLKISKYKNSFKEITPLIITDRQNIDLAKFLSDYISFFTENASYIEVGEVEQNISLFDRANLLVITKDIYDANDFSYLEKTNKKLLIIESTKYYLEKEKTQQNKIYKIIEPISFFKMVEALTNISPSKDTSLLSYMQKKEQDENKNYNILIAEDNSINMKLIEKILAQYKNITITQAVNGQEAMDEYMKQHFDLILMDIAMPVVDGLSATKKIIEYENINSLPHPPIIALTANALKGDKEKFLSAGMDEYLTKPVKEDDLIAILNKFGINLSKQESTTVQTTPQLPVKDEKSTKEDSKLPQKEILIYKKSKVETKIFQKVLNPVYKDIDTATDTKTFLDKLKEQNYQAILLDTELQDLDIETISKLKKEHKNSAFILFRNFETKIDNKLRAVFDEIVINSADKSYLKTILDNYIKKEEKEES